MENDWNQPTTDNPIEKMDYNPIIGRHKGALSDYVNEPSYSKVLVKAVSKVLSLIHRKAKRSM